MSAEAMANEHLRRLVGKLDQWRNCMSYTESYFGEPPGLVKSAVRELAKAVDPIYPPLPKPVDPLAGVTIYTGTAAPLSGAQRIEGAAPDLLAVLSKITAELDRLQKDHPQWPTSPMRDEAIAAIAKATGEQP